MPSSDPPTEITIKIKVPPGHLPPAAASTAAASSDSEQFSLGIVPVGTTLGALRAHIQNVVPSQPPPERQRILYGGRALVDNEQTVGDALNVKRDPTQGEYVIHLLIKGEGGTSRTPTPNSIPAGSHAGIGGVPPPSNAVTSQLIEGNTQQNVTGRGSPSLEQQRQMLEQQRARARQMEMQQAAMRQHMQAHWNATHASGHMMPGGQQPQMQGLGSTAMASGQGQQGPQSDAAPSLRGADANQAQEQNTRPETPQNHQQHLPPHQRVGQGFHIQGVGPDGQRFQIHQQTLNFPAIHLPPGMQGQHMMHMPHDVPGTAPHNTAVGHRNSERQAQGPSALDQARENMAEMRRMLDELSAQTSGATEENRRSSLEDIRRRARRLNEYIDPLYMHNINAAMRPRSRESTPVRQATPQQAPIPPMPNGLPNLPRGLRVVHPHAHPGVMMPQPQQQTQHPSSAANEVTAYLLSSPHGPQALLLSPEHGTYTGTMPLGGALRPTPTTTQPQETLQPNQPAQPPNPAIQPPAAVGAPADPVADAARQNLLDGANVQAQQAANGAPQDPFGMQAILGHVWLLIRILIFAYFLLGSNMGWQRPIILVGIGLGFWLVRLGALGDGGAVRRWWEGVVGAPPRPLPQEVLPGQANAAAAAPAAAPPAAPLAEANDRARQPVAMPTPEQVAQRLLNEAEARQRERNHWLRERLRPVERAVALFLASLWPGIGEGYVREQRRLREEEVEAQRRAEEESRAKEAEEKENETSKEKLEAGESSTATNDAKERTSAEGDLRKGSENVSS